MTPKNIAQIAHDSDVKKVVLSHRMKRTLKHENESKLIIKQIYNGKVVFAEDRMKLEL